MTGNEEIRESAVKDKQSGIDRRKEGMRALKFALFSVSAGIIEIVLYTLLDVFTDWPYWPCYLIALIASVLWNFTLNRQFTFQSANNVPVAMLKVAAFYAVFTPASTIFGNYLAESLGWPGILVTGINMAFNFVLEFLYDRFFVFGKSLDTNARAQRNK
ncbi:MAG: GtrA family protein [Lachnospiraceae bacterium]|nr:GtrA family protein [Lachnospiraceae bacterium]